MTRFDATGRRALWTSGQLGTADLTTSPQAQQQQQKRSIHMVHKPVNSVCYRHVEASVTPIMIDKMVADLTIAMGSGASESNPFDAPRLSFFARRAYGNLSTAVFHGEG